MTVEETVADFMEAEGHVWKLKDGREIIPSSKDVRKALDEAAARLYTGSEGDQVEIAGLLVVKTDVGFSAYVLAGNYT